MLLNQRLCQIKGFSIKLKVLLGTNCINNKKFTKEEHQSLTMTLAPKTIQMVDITAARMVSPLLNCIR